MAPTADLLRRSCGMYNDHAALREEPEYNRYRPVASLRKIVGQADLVFERQRNNRATRNAFEQLFHGCLYDYPTNFRRVPDAEVSITTGTESGANLTPHGNPLREPDLYVRLGRTATVNAAKLPGIEEEASRIGTSGSVLVTETIHESCTRYVFRRIKPRW